MSFESSLFIKLEAHCLNKNQNNNQVNVEEFHCWSQGTSQAQSSSPTINTVQSSYLAEVAVDLK